MSADRAPTLRRALAIRTTAAIAAGLLSLVLVLVAVYTLEHRRLDAIWQREAGVHFATQTRRVDADWVRQADLLRAQIEFAGLLEGERRLATAKFTALLAAFGGQSTFTHVQVRGPSGAPIMSYATRTGSKTQFAEAPSGAWAYSETDALVYRLIRAPLRLGSQGAGELVLFVPLNNALLSSIAFPDARISLRWHGKTELAVSDGPAPMPPRPASGERLLESSFAWAGAPGGPELRVLRAAREALSLAEVVVLTTAGAVGAALLAWLMIGRWARGHVRQLESLQSAVERFTARERVAPDLGGSIVAATAGSNAELHRLGEGLVSLMKTTEAASAEKLAAYESLAELNATLERRVVQRTRQLAIARDEALAAARTKEQILAGVSHELRTPLVGLLGSLELADLSDLPPEQRRLVEVARRSGEALRTVIDDVLDYSRLEAVGVALRHVPFRLDDLAAEAIALHAAVALNKGLHLGCRCEEAAEQRVSGDPGRLRQVLLNLIGNAVKFTDRGSVELFVGMASSDADRQRSRIRFEVRDTGIGIDEATRAQLFRPFVQADAVRTSTRGGTGLGLAICQRLVVAMGGRIELQSTPGAGSTFRFELELPWAEASAPPPRAADAAGPLHGRVLLAEDNPVNRMIASEMLRRLGLEVEEAENGLLALEALRARSADLVLMDHQMPVLDGLGATARIRSGEAGPLAAGVPIVAVTANAQQGDLEKCLSAGMNDYLAKPFSQAELAATLLRWLRPADAPGADR